MNHCVPEWDPAGRDLDSIFDPANLLNQSKSRWDSGQPRKSDMAFAPDDDFEELCWEEGQLLVVMHGLSKRGNKSKSSHVNASDRVSSPSGLASIEDVNATATAAAAGRGLGLIDPLAPGNSTQEDELLSWLQHPSDETLDGKCCCPTDVAHADTPWKGSESMCRHDAAHHDATLNSVISRHSSAGLVLGNFRSDSTSESTSQQATMAHGHCHVGGNFMSGLSSTAATTVASSSARHDCGSLMAKAGSHIPQLPPPLPVGGAGSSWRPTRSLMENFAHFSRPVAAIKANLEDIGITSGPIGVDRLKQLDRVGLDAFTSEHIKSTTECVSPNFTMRGGNAVNWGLGTSFTQNHVERISSKKGEKEPSVSTQGVVDGSSGVTLEATEPTVTFSLDGFESCPHADGKKITGGGKRKMHDDVEDCEYQSNQDHEYGSAAGKKKHMNVKRSRAPENHNQSERKRRNKIKEKMKALQELIPNVSKTDKASMLEDAIVYIKTLQQNVQIMTFRNGMNVSPMLIPHGMQHLQMATLPQMGMGMLDMSATVGTQTIQPSPLPSVHGMIMPTVTSSSLPTNGFPTAPFSGVSRQGVPHPIYHMLVPVRPVIPSTSTHHLHTCRHQM